MIDRLPGRMLTAVLVSALAALVLSGCMLARSSSPLTIIAPQVEVEVGTDWPEVDWALLVQRPSADQMRNSDRILVRVSRSRLQPWADAAWLDSMPDMIHALLIQSLEDSGRFAGVGRAGGMRSRFSLVSEIRRFEVVDDGSGRLIVELGLHVNLVHHATGQVMATRSFASEQPVRGRTLDGVIDAFEQAMSGLFSDVTGWTLDAGQQASVELEDWRDRWRDRQREGRRR